VAGAKPGAARLRVVSAPASGPGRGSVLVFSGSRPPRRWRRPSGWVVRSRKVASSRRISLGRIVGRPTCPGRLRWCACRVAFTERRSRPAARLICNGSANVGRGTHRSNCGHRRVCGGQVRRNSEDGLGRAIADQQVPGDHIGQARGSPEPRIDTAPGLCGRERGAGGGDPPVACERSGSRSSRTAVV